MNLCWFLVKLGWSSTKWLELSLLIFLPSTYTILATPFDFTTFFTLTILNRAPPLFTVGLFLSRCIINEAYLVAFAVFTMQCICCYAAKIAAFFTVLYFFITGHLINSIHIWLLRMSTWKVLLQQGKLKTLMIHTYLLYIFSLWNMKGYNWVGHFFQTWWSSTSGSTPTCHIWWLMKKHNRWL